MTDIRSNFMSKTKKWQEPLESYVFPVLLVLWPLAAFRQGVSVMDTTYSLGNYEYLGPSDGFWFFATYLANRAGTLISKLPFCDTMAGMNAVCLLFISMTALFAYFILGRMMPRWMVFAGEFIAIAYCWCPAVILYNTLTYFLLTLVCLFLFLGISSEDRDIWFLAAGISLGLSIMVKVANGIWAVLIMCVWFEGMLSHKKAAYYIRKTLMCIAGTFCGFGAGVLLVCIKYGPSMYISMIPELLSATSSTSSYSAAGMLGAIALAWLHSLRWFLIAAACVIAGILFLAIPLLKDHILVKKLICLLGMPVLLKYYYSRGMFTVNYQDYPAMFEWGSMFMIIAVCVSIIGVLGLFKATRRERFLSLMCLILITVLPLGSNNYTYPVIGCMFITAPFTLWMIRRIRAASNAENSIKAEKTSSTDNNFGAGEASSTDNHFGAKGWKAAHGNSKKELHFPLEAMIIAVLFMVVFQGSMFHMCFAFRDGTDGSSREAKIEKIEAARGMYTTKENAQALEGLYSFLEENGLLSEKLISFGDAPGLHYLMGMEPAIDTTWPDLDSYSYERFEIALAKCETDGEYPVIIVKTENGAVSDSTEIKEALLSDFMVSHGYTDIYDNKYIVYVK